MRPSSPQIPSAEVETLLTDPIALERLAEAQVAALQRLLVEERRLETEGLYDDTGLTWEGRQWLIAECPVVTLGIDGASIFIMNEPLLESGESRERMRRAAVEVLTSIIANCLTETPAFSEISSEELFLRAMANPDSISTALVADHWLGEESVTRDQLAELCRKVDRPLCAVASERYREIDNWLSGLSIVDLKEIADPYGVHSERVRTAARASLHRQGIDGLEGDLEFASELLNLVERTQRLTAARAGAGIQELKGELAMELSANWERFARNAAWRSVRAGTAPDLQASLKEAYEEYKRLAQPVVE